MLGGPVGRHGPGYPVCLLGHSLYRGVEPDAVKEWPEYHFEITSKSSQEG